MIYAFSLPHSKPKQPKDFQGEPKYLVFASQLLELFETCTFCGGPSVGQVVNTVGTLIQVRQQCANCGYQRTWNSQPYMHQMPVGNLILSAAILLSGNLPSQTLRLFNLMNVPCICRSTFHRHQSRYVIPSILQSWTDEQAAVIEEAKQLGGGLCLAGDGRCDSPGHSAKYGGYNTIEVRLNKVIDVQLVQVCTFITFKI